MNEAENHILEYLKGSPDTFHARKEISRRAIRTADFELNPRWAAAPLTSLADRKVIETDNSGGYRLTSKNDYR